jgi:hypothetical protein
MVNFEVEVVPPASKLWTWGHAPTAAEEQEQQQQFSVIIQLP